MRVETDDGCWGTGEVWGNFPPWGCRDRVEILSNVLRPLLVGQVLDDPVRIFRSAAASIRPLANQLGAPGPFQQALAGVDIALWDACAPVAAASALCRLHTRRAAHRRVSPSMRRTCRSSGRPVIEEMASKGHTRFKFRIPANEDSVCGPLAKRAPSRAGRALMADATQSYSLERLRPLARPLADLALDWLEEPFLADDIMAYTGLAG